ncbi:MAG TPA: four helix bundle protein [Thermoanaerobaculia bacterium]|nr:four helix bundle protein [Thermoanaerobaculia bacterium]
MKVERFEDLIAWQKARVLTREVYVQAMRGKFADDYVLSKQIRSAALSVSSNIAEGFDRGNRNEFTQFLSIAKASCAEVRNHLYVAADVGYIDEATATALITKANEVARIVTGLRTAVAKQRNRPTKS